MSSIKKALVIFHKDCPDGFLAATIAKTFLGESADYLGYVHSDPVPTADLLKDKTVYILDFSFKEKDMQFLELNAEKVVLLDHHITAKTSLANYCACHRPSLFSNIDLSKSGAMLAWEYFYPDKPAPKIVKLVQARDIYTWDEDFAREILVMVDMLGFDFEKWEPLLTKEEEFWESLKEKGKTILTKYSVLIENNVKMSSPILLNGVLGYCVNNNNKEITNEIGVELARLNKTFGLVWHIADGVVKCSLRCEHGFDVEALAKLFGGGGHTKASAFTLPIDQLPRLLSNRLSGRSAV